MVNMLSGIPLVYDVLVWYQVYSDYINVNEVIIEQFVQRLSFGIPLVVLVIQILTE